MFTFKYVCLIAAILIWELRSNFALEDALKENNEAERIEEAFMKPYLVEFTTVDAFRTEKNFVVISSKIAKTFPIILFIYSGEFALNFSYAWWNF